MAKTAPHPRLAEAIADLVAQIEQADKIVGPYDQDPNTFFARRRREMDRVAANLHLQWRAKIAERGDGTHVRMLGIASSSTIGLHQALSNWIVGARRRLNPGA